MELQIIRDRIYIIRGYRVIMDRDLAELYQVETKALKQAVKRNIDRFPFDFMFELTKEEYLYLKSQMIETSEKESPNLRSQFVTSSWGGERYLPYVFTEQGVAMLSSVLRNPTAIVVNISIMRAFVLMRHMVTGYEELTKRLEKLEENTDIQFSEIYKAITKLLTQPEPTPRNPIGYLSYKKDK